jgi:hypothetical protein
MKILNYDSLKSRSVLLTLVSSGHEWLSQETGSA